MICDDLRSYPVDFGNVVALAMVRDSDAVPASSSTIASLHGLRGPLLFAHLMHDSDVWLDVGSSDHCPCALFYCDHLGRPVACGAVPPEKQAHPYPGRMDCGGGASLELSHW